MSEVGERSPDGTTMVTLDGDLRIPILIVEVKREAGEGELYYLGWRPKLKVSMFSLCSPLSDAFHRSAITIRGRQHSKNPVVSSSLSQVGDG